MIIFLWIYCVICQPLLIVRREFWKPSLQTRIWTQSLKSVSERYINFIYQWALRKRRRYLLTRYGNKSLCLKEQNIDFVPKNENAPNVLQERGIKNFKALCKSEYTKLKTAPNFKSLSMNSNGSLPFLNSVPKTITDYISFDTLFFMVNLSHTCCTQTIFFQVMKLLQ